MSVFERYKFFRQDREQVEENQNPGRSSTTKYDENSVNTKNVFNIDCRLSVRMISEHLNFSKTTVHKMVTENLGKRKIFAKLVPKVLTDEQ